MTLDELDTLVGLDFMWLVRRHKDGRFFAHIMPLEFASYVADQPDLPPSYRCTADTPEGAVAGALKAMREAVGIPSQETTH